MISEEYMKETIISHINTAGGSDKLRMENLLLASNNVEIVITLREVLVAYAVNY